MTMFSTGFNPINLTSPEDVSRFARYQEVKKELREAQAEVSALDNIDGVDLDSRPGVVAVNRHRVGDTIYTGTVQAETMDLEAQRRSSFGMEYSYETETTYQIKDNAYYIGESFKSEEQIGRYASRLGSGYKTERFRENNDGTLTYSSTGNRRSWENPPRKI